MNRKRPESSTLKGRIDENRLKSQQSRFKITNCTRTLDEGTIVDVEKERATPAAASEPQASAQSSSYSDLADEPFVYDIYIAEPNPQNQYPDSIDLNDLRLVLAEDVLCSYSAYI